MKSIKINLRVLYWAANFWWPAYRRLIQHQLTPRCMGCGLSARLAPLSNGLCAMCQTQGSAHRSSGEAATDSFAPDPSVRHAFDSYIEQLQGQGRGKYDLLLFFSGGKDSTYLLQAFRTRFPRLRILALTIDNGFRSPFAQQNSPQICRWLKVDHLELRPYTIFQRLYHYGFKHFSRHGFSYTDIWEGELFQDIGRNLAAQMGIPAMALGYTPEQTANLPSDSDPYQLYSQAQAINQANQHFTRTTFLDIPLATIFTPLEMRYWWDATRYPSEAIPVMLFPWLAWGYHKEAVQQAVQGIPILGRGEAHPDLTNDLYVSLGLMLDYKHLGYSHYETEFANLVRSGKEDYQGNRNFWEFCEYLALHSRLLLRLMPVWRYCLAELDLAPHDLLR